MAAEWSKDNAKAVRCLVAFLHDKQPPEASCIPEKVLQQNCKGIADVVRTLIQNPQRIPMVQAMSQDDCPEMDKKKRSALASDDKPWPPQYCHWNDIPNYWFAAFFAQATKNYLNPAKFERMLAKDKLVIKRMVRLALGISANFKLNSVLRNKIHFRRFVDEALHAGEEDHRGLGTTDGVAGRCRVMGDWQGRLLQLRVCGGCRCPQPRQVRRRLHCNIEADHQVYHWQGRPDLRELGPLTAYIVVDENKLTIVNWFKEVKVGEVEFAHYVAKPCTKTAIEELQTEFVAGLGGGSVGSKDTDFGAVFVAQPKKKTKRGPPGHAAV